RPLPEDGGRLVQAEAGMPRAGNFVAPPARLRDEAARVLHFDGHHAADRVPPHIFDAQGPDGDMSFRAGAARTGDAVVTRLALLGRPPAAEQLRDRPAERVAGGGISLYPAELADLVALPRRRRLPSLFRQLAVPLPPPPPQRGGCAAFHREVRLDRA